MTTSTKILGFFFWIKEMGSFYFFCFLLVSPSLSNLMLSDKNMIYSIM